MMNFEKSESGWAKIGHVKGREENIDVAGSPGCEVLEMNSHLS